MNGRRGLLVFVMILGLTPPVWSQSPAPAATPVLPSTKAWSQLSAQQRAVLAPLSEDWAELPAASQHKWLQVAARFHELDAAEQGRVRHRMAEWAHMSPQERLKARIGWHEAQRVAPEQRQSKWERYQALPPDERAALQERAAQRLSKATAPNLPNPGTSPGSLMVRARAGATTVPITRRAPPATVPPRPLTLAGVDPTTLLPRPPAAPASQP